MDSVLILYSSTDGHTREICLRLRELIQLAHHQVTLAPLSDFLDADLKVFDKIVIGARIRYGRHHPEVIRFIERHDVVLNEKASAFFSVNLVARKPEKNQPETNPYMKKFLGKIAWKPGKLAVFAGKINYPAYNIVERSVIRFIMLIDHGPTQRDACIDFTDWSKVEDFANVIITMK
jgi:menaquinone-dependent protoporphyrinogen oxidase